MTRKNRKKIAAGNWKMNGTARVLAEADEIGKAADGARAVQTILCVPATLIDRARTGSALNTVHVGGQDCHPDTAGAHTGDVSAEMLSDAGATHVIVGHSERRADHSETSETVAAKARAAWRDGLTAIICIGETEAEYRAGRTEEVLDDQITRSVPVAATPENTIIAYEPVWAIGTGLTPEPGDIARLHKVIRDKLRELHGNDDFSILYGGSVNDGNADSIFALEDVDGGLVGGASLTAQKFVPIIEALDRAGDDA